MAFAKKAGEEGLPQIAKLFRAAVEAEIFHALNHLRVMGQVKTPSVRNTFEGSAPDICPTCGPKEKFVKID